MVGPPLAQNGTLYLPQSTSICLVLPHAHIPEVAENTLFFQYLADFLKSET